jgi:hypothetical protein
MLKEDQYESTLNPAPSNMPFNVRVISNSSSINKILYFTLPSHHYFHYIEKDLNKL